MRSLLDAEGPVETAKQGRGEAQSEDHRIDQVVSKLSRYKVSVAAMQGTRLYGSNVYRVGECHAGSRLASPTSRRTSAERKGCGLSAQWCSCDSLERGWRAVEGMESKTCVSSPTNR